MNVLKLNGNNLTLNDLREVVYERRAVLLEPHARIQVEHARAVLEEAVTSDRAPNFAIQPGEIHLFNPAGSPPADTELAFPESEIRALMLLRANSLAKGYSGVRPAVIDTLCEMLNRAVHPALPSLAPPLQWEGDVLLEGKRLAAAQAFQQAGIAPLKLEPAEVVSLVGGSQPMLASGTLALLAAETLADSADVLAALAFSIFQESPAPLDERIHKLRPHAGQSRSAANLRRMLEGQEGVREPNQGDAENHDPALLRSIPQVHGAVRDVLDHCRQVLETEMNSALDDWLFFPAPKQVGVPQALGQQAIQGESVLTANSHGQPLVLVLDYLTLALASLAGISERRLECIAASLPRAAQALGAEGNPAPAIVKTAQSLISENRPLACPASVNFIYGRNEEDYLSLGLAAAKKLQKTVANTRTVLALEALAAALALDCGGLLKPAKLLRQAHTLIRSAAPAHGRDLQADAQAVATLIAGEKLAAILW